MFSALLSFLGGSAFRLIWGQISDFLNKRQDHKYEIERLKLQAEADAAQHARNLEALRVQHEMGVDVIRVQGEADAGRLEMEGWAAAVREANRTTGVTWVDAWNGIIRPLVATVAIGLWAGALYRQDFTMGEWDKELVGVILGFYFATRIRQKGE